MLFCNEERPKLKEAHPEWKVPEMGKALGAKWKELTDEDKAPFNEKVMATISTRPCLVVTLFSKTLEALRHKSKFWILTILLCKAAADKERYTKEMETYVVPEEYKNDDEPKPKKAKANILLASS